MRCRTIVCRWIHFSISKMVIHSFFNFTEQVYYEVGKYFLKFNLWGVVRFQKLSLSLLRRPRPETSQKKNKIILFRHIPLYRPRTPYPAPTPHCKPLAHRGINLLYIMYFSWYLNCRGTYFILFIYESNTNTRNVRVISNRMSLCNLNPEPNIIYRGTTNW